MLHSTRPIRGEYVRREVTEIADTDALPIETGQQTLNPESSSTPTPSPSEETSPLAPLSERLSTPGASSQMGTLPPARWQPGPLRRAHGWIRLRFRSADERRLEALRTRFAGQLARREQAAHQAGRTMGTWGEAADALLSEAEVALQRSDIDTAWSCFEEAMRMDVFAYDPTELAAARTALAAEAAEGLGSWRGEAITHILDGPDQAFGSRLAKLVPDQETREKIDTLLSPQARDQAVIDHIAGLLKDAKVSRPADTAQAIEGLAAEREQARKTALYVAMGLRDEDGAEEARRLAQLRRQLLCIGGILALTLVGLLLLAVSAPIGLLAAPGNVGNVLWGYVALFGVLGGGLSTFRSISGRARMRLPVHLLHMLLTATRPLLGAIGALAAYVLLQSGALGFRPTTTAAVLLVAFLAGFTERLVVRAVEPLQLLEEPTPAKTEDNK